MFVHRATYTGTVMTTRDEIAAAVARTFYTMLIGTVERGRAGNEVIVRWRWVGGVLDIYECGAGVLTALILGLLWGGGAGERLRAWSRTWWRTVGMTAGVIVFRRDRAILPAMRRLSGIRGGLSAADHYL